MNAAAAACLVRATTVTRTLTRDSDRLGVGRRAFKSLATLIAPGGRRRAGQVRLQASGAGDLVERDKSLDATVPNLTRRDHSQ